MKFSKLLSVMLVICMVISMLPVVAFASAPGVVYLKPNGEWLADGARFAAYFYGNGDAWVDCTDSDGDGIYEAAVPDGLSSVIFCRMNPADGSNNWDNKWNQTGDLALPTDGNNCYNVEGWDFGNGYWSTYTPKSETVDYYLVGYINGANHGCEEDHQNMGNYKFVNGKLVATFTSDSYVFVKTTDNAKWYLAESYCDDTSCKLVTNGSEKMFVPSNVEVTFTLKVNDDDTVTLSYVAASSECSHSYTSKTTTAATCTSKGVKTYTCSKCADTYTEEIPMKSHSYSGGTCSACGKLDPDYVVTDTGFVLVTDIANITDGKYVIVALVNGSYKAMGTTLASGKFNGVDVNVSNRVVTGDNLPIWDIQTVDGGITLSVDGKYLNYASSTNFKFADSAYAWAVTAGENGFLFNSTANGRGIYYGITAAKFGAYTSTTSSYVSQLMVFKYQVGTQGCSHSYSSKVTTEATCTSKGVKTFTCSLCGNSYTESIPATGHSYENGKCTICGTADPNYTVDYYLFGFINGANYGCEEDHENLGSYKFVNGKLVATFASDSYIGVKTDKGAWYMAKAYVTDTTATLYNTNTGVSEKMFVPGNAEVTFTLKVNDDDTVTLSYVAASSECSHSYTSKTTTAATCTSKGVKTYTCSKCADTYTEEIPMKSHSYSGGTCSACGKLDPDYVVTDTGFVLVTDIANITDGKYVIVALVNGSYKAMGTTLASGKFNGVDVNVSNRVVTGDNLPIWDIQTVDGGITLSVDGKYLNYASSTNFKFADSAYAWAVTAGENGFIFNSAANGRGIYCQISSGKFGAYASATSSYVSQLMVFKYQVGTQGCSHSYSSKVTTEATCTSKGVKTFTCSLCGNSYTESIPATGHSYENGKCTICGTADPNYTVDYYLFGFINGANYGCEEDHENLGSYKFVNGKLVATFASDSYIGVKTDKGAWYMAKAYVTDTTATLYNTNTGVSEKMFVPGNAEVTFTLKVNDDDTVTLSYTAEYLQCEHSYSSKVTTEATCTSKGVKTYTCSKCADTYTEEISMKSHSYSGGSCSVCGASDPDYVGTYYQVGSASAITAGGQFVIVAQLSDGSYKALTTTLSSGKFVASDISVSGTTISGSGLPVWNIAPVSGGISLSVGGQYLAYNSSTNFKFSSDAYTWTVAEGESGFIFDSAATSRGIYYQLSSAKFGAYSTSYVNSASYISNLLVFKARTGDCSHNYVSGVCGNCGEVDPNYVPDPDYYLFGYINGADYEGTDYLFVDGKLTVKFSEESYVAVKTSNNAFYMTNGYVGSATSATLYKFTDPNSVSANKLMVPGGQTVHFTLTENWDGNLIISYTVDPADCKHTSHNTDGICDTCGTTVEHSYSLGVCTVCNAMDPNYGGFEYYLFGYINGANYGCEEDYDTLGEYKFVNGKLTVTFAADSYVGVKEVYPGAKFGPEVVAWYMAQSYVADSTATLYNTNTGVSEKMFVPGNAEVTFTLKVNDDDTVTLSYTAEYLQCEHSYSSEVTTEATCTSKGVMTYTCSKCADTYTEEIPMKSHSYSGGTCSACGKLDPDYVVTDTGFVLVTDIANITDGKYVIVALVNGSYKAMGTTLASGKFNGVDVNVSNRVVTGDNLPIWDIQTVDGGITLSVDGKYLNYASSTNFKFADSAYAWAVTAGENGFLFNSTANGRGIYYGITAAKFGAYTSTTSSYVSQLMVFKYQVGTQGCNHNYSSEMTTEPTCTADGLETFTCSLCGDVYKVIHGATGHSYTSKVTTAATCTAEGVKTNTCSACGDKYTEVIPATGHKYSNGKCTVCGNADPNCDHSYTSKVTIAATCLADGVKTNTCSKCGDVSTEVIPATGHKYVDEIVPPTCDNNGYTRHRCENCGEYGLNTDPVNPLGHDETSVVTPPTCTEKGYTTFTCNRCGQVRTWYETQPTGHSYVGGKCSTCGEKDPDYNVDYYLFGFINGSNYACEEDWENLGQYKFVDGKLVVTFTSDSYVGVKTGDNNTWYMTKEYVSASTATLYNTNTGAGEKLFVPGNTEVTFTLIVNEDDTLTLSYTAEALPCEHNYSSKVTTAATCTSKGVMTYTCSKCADTYTEEIPVGDHSYTGGSCSVCGKLDPNYVVSDTGFVLVTDIANITDGKYVIVVLVNGDYKAMGTTLASGKFAPVDVNVANRIVTGDSLPVWDIQTVDGGVAISVDGKYLAYNSSTNFKFATDAYTWAVTAGENGFLFNSTANGRGIYYGISAGKFGAYASATSSYVSQLMVFKYQVGTQGCNHDYTSEITTTPTCNTKGVMTFTCIMCGHSYTETIPSIDHSYNAKVTTAATCTKAGVMTYSCSACGDKYTEVIPAAGHSFDNGKCTVCGIADPNCDHSYTSKITTAPTCTAEGVETFTCSKCGNSYNVILGAKGHSYTSKVTTAATCTKDGVKTNTCSACGDKYTEVIPATGHKYSNGKCTVCGNADPNCSHSYSSKVTIAATCLTDGVKTYTCSKCGDVYTEAIAATGHSYVDEVVAPSCENNGYTRHRCVNCGEYGLNTDPVNPLGHDETAVVTPPTCTEEGYTTYTCNRCGQVRTWYVTQPTGHSYVAGKCTNCGDVDANYKLNYYLVGYINGVNYGCEEDSQNMGSLKFVNGKLTATFTQDSYVFVKITNNDIWYMARSYSNANSVTLYNTNTGAGEKLYVPGNVKLVFTLVENADGSLTLSYVVDAASCSHSVHTITGYCSSCGQVVEHTYVNGKCICGAIDPSIGSTVDYYLFGYINGSNYACEDDWTNMGQYKFVNGKLTATFTQDSYVAIKDSTNANWYMFQSYIPNNSGTLYNTNTGSGEKMFVPGGVEVTFTLTVNSGDTLFLSYTTGSGAATVPTLTLSHPSLSFEDEILYNVYYTVDNPAGIREMGLVTFNSKLTSGTIANAVDIIPGYVNEGSTYMVRSNGIPAKNLGDALYFKVYAKLSDGSYVYSDVAGYNAVAYAKTVLSSSSSSMEAKALMVAMLNYGAAAQTYFGYNTGNLMNAFLTDAGKSLVKAYDESMVSDVVKADTSKTGSFVMNGGYSNIWPTVSFEGAFSINYYFTLNKTADKAPTMYYWDAETYNSVSKLTAQNATGVITMKQDGSNWGAAVEGIAAKDMDSTIYVAGIYTSNGISYPTSVISYSLGKYCETIAANGEAFGAATAVYGYYAKAYFA